LPPPHFVVEHSTRYCSVIETMPSKASDLKILGDRQGYGSKDQAEQALKGMSGCKAQG
jgi:hypothetical protein